MDRAPNFGRGNFSLLPHKLLVELVFESFGNTGILLCTYNRPYLFATLESLSPPSSENNIGVRGLKHVWLHPCIYRVALQRSSTKLGMRSTMFVHTKPISRHEQVDNSLQHWCTMRQYAKTSG